MNSTLPRALFYFFVPGGAAALSLKPMRSTASLLIIFILLLAFTTSRAITSFSGILLLSLSIVIVHAWNAIKEAKELKHRRKPNILRLTISLLAIAIVGISALIYRPIIFGIDLYYIPSGSMAPTLLPGDIVLANTWTGENSIQAGDIIVFEHPDVKSFLLIKRVISKDEISVSVAGDNLASSLDSRTLGRIPWSLVKAKATERLRGLSVAIVSRENQFEAERITCRWSLTTCKSTNIPTIN
ncbi:signal peptidase I [Pseudomonas alcaligenes]|uniref:signal peptidase I n=1 Tax=Aquipseudomonas alcaligenes TaxID=43263 RepID=UPI002E7B88F0|nr:signal peptidase I [Pseudomonas alcaligenes]MEE1951625.1 signal peptidase I [Pseudomonas alcaligenes]